MKIKEHNVVLSVIIPIHNPKKEHLVRVLRALENQSLDKQLWELLKIDNASYMLVSSQEMDVSWHRNITIIYEEKFGATWARVRGVREGKGKYILNVDDDNVLDADYLKNVIDIFLLHKDIGMIGGKNIPKFKETPSKRIYNIAHSLACHDYGDREIISHYEYNKKGKKRWPKYSLPGA